MLTFFLACWSQPQDSAFTVTQDTSYPGLPELQAVSASCTDGVVAYRARTIGWSNFAAVDVWNTNAQPDSHESVELPTVGFLRDEYCDLMELRLNAKDSPNPSTALGRSKVNCDEFDTGVLTLLFQVWYEEGCAGAQVYGADPNAVYADTQTVNGEPTRSPHNDDCLPDNAGDTEHIRGTVMDEVPPCSQPLD